MHLKMVTLMHSFPLANALHLTWNVWDFLMFVFLVFVRRILIVLYCAAAPHRPSAWLWTFEWMLLGFWVFVCACIYLFFGDSCFSRSVALRLLAYKWPVVCSLPVFIDSIHYINKNVVCPVPTGLDTKDLFVLFAFACPAIHFIHFGVETWK